MRVFARYMPQAEHDDLVDALVLEQRLQHRIQAGCSTCASSAQSVSEHRELCLNIIVTSDILNDIVLQGCLIPVRAHALTADCLPACELHLQRGNTARPGIRRLVGLPSELRRS